MKRKFKIEYTVSLDVEVEGRCIKDAKGEWLKNNIPNDRITKVTEIEPYGNIDVTNEFIG